MIHLHVVQMRFAKSEMELVRVPVYPITLEIPTKDADQNVFRIRIVFIRKLV